MTCLQDREGGEGVQVFSTELPEYLAIVPPSPLSCLSSALEPARHVTHAALTGSVFSRIWFCVLWSWLQLKSLFKDVQEEMREDAPLRSPAKHVIGHLLAWGTIFTWNSWVNSHLLLMFPSSPKIGLLRNEGWSSDFCPEQLYL